MEIFFDRNNLFKPNPISVKFSKNKLPHRKLCK